MPESVLPPVIHICVYVCVCCSTPYKGEYAFEISFQQQSKETKSTTWTVRGPASPTPTLSCTLLV